MGKVIIKNEEVKSIKKALKKFSEKEILLNNGRLKGSFKISAYRKYEFEDEVDIEFKGEIYARYNNKESQWFKSDIYNAKGTSKIKVNKLIKNNIFNEVKSQCSYFGINLKLLSDIKKIKWS